MRARALIGANLLLAAAYAATAYAAMQTAELPGGTAPLWPAAGLAFVLVALKGPRFAPGVALGELAVMTLTGTKPWAAAVLGTANALAAIGGARVWLHAGGSPQLHRLRDVLVLTVCALGAGLVTASAGTGMLLQSGAIPGHAFVSTWWVWWLGDVAGVLVCAPLLFALLGGREARAHEDGAAGFPPWLELVGWAGVVLAVAVPVLDAEIGQPYVLCPVLVWLGLRLGTRAVALANLVVAVLAVRLAVTGHGPFIQPTRAESLLASQTFLVVMAVMSLVIAAVAAELRTSRRAEARLAAEQTALREVAEAIARQDDLGQVRALAAERRAAVADAAQLDALVTVAEDAARARDRLVERATTDPLTGLVDHGEFHRLAAAELGRANRHDHPLSLAVFDLDGFKAVNDAHGHLAGDAVLREVAAVLRDTARAEDVVARLGGDELALLMPETGGAGAIAAVERCRSAVERALLGPGEPVTISAGLCDLRHAQTVEGLVRRADDALYWVKRRGGNRCAIYTPSAMATHGREEHADDRERAQALTGIRAMARTIDARVPATRRHSERVAELAARLAEHRSWPSERIDALRQAALIHDVGKLAVPENVLFKAGRLDPEERREVQRHAATGAEIAAELMSADQVGWIRSHHERYDGLGYPDGIAGDEIPEGAALLAVADAWDAMTAARHWATPLSADQALAELVACEGTQFAPWAVDALRAVAPVQAGAITT